MADNQWDEWYAKSIGVFLNGGALERGRRGEEYTDDSFFLLFNAHHEPISFTMPDPRYGEHWAVVIDTRTDDVTEEGGAVVKAGGSIDVEARSVVVLRREP
jgi:glycogen operon protein